MRSSTLFIALQALEGLLLQSVAAYGIPQARRNASVPSVSRRLKKRTLGKRDDDPSDFSWVKRWAAVGDSYTAGIGSGTPLGNFLTQLPGETDWYCSRYDQAWPMIVNDALGGSVEKFEFAACSGGRTGDVFQQIQSLDGDLDLVMLTAGGNDLCLAKMLEKCVFVPSGDSACDDVIKIAHDNLDNILKDNIRQLMKALDDKMNDDGVVVYNGYAQFFNTDNEDCVDQHWAFLTTWPGNSGLTVERRQTFNDLVKKINGVIKAVVDETASNPDYKWKIGFSNWDPWVYDGVRGQMCDPDGSGVYPDPDQPDLQFFKPSTNTDGDNTELRRREDMYERMAERREAADADVGRRSAEIAFEESTARSVNPPVAARNRLGRRNPTPAGCPGDTKDEVQPPSIGLPDSVGKNFHPNVLGHYTIASFALQTMIDTRAAVLDLEPPTCEITDKFTCWQKQGSKAYASADRLNEDYKDFCDEASGQDGKSGWSHLKTYHEGTPDETGFLVSLSATSGTLAKDECLERMSDIINNCDGNDPENPMNWKFGGEYARGDFVYQVNPMREYRHWPVPKEAGGDCKGWYHGFWSSYILFGYGWSSYDSGQQTLLPSAKGCIGGGLTMWTFEYFDEADKDGYEWKATFNTPIWVRSRCFKNNKAQFAAGGFTDGCGGND